jgi:transcription antitermination factor NusG
MAEQTFEEGDQVKVTPPEMLGKPYEGKIVYLNTANERAEIKIEGLPTPVLAHIAWLEKKS